MVMAKFLIIKAGLAFIQHDRQKPTPDLKFFFSIINDETKKVSPQSAIFGKQQHHISLSGVFLLN